MPWRYACASDAELAAQIERSLLLIAEAHRLEHEARRLLDEGPLRQHPRAALLSGVIGRRVLRAP